MLLCYNCFAAVCVLYLFLTVPWVGLQYVVVVIPGHTRLLFVNYFLKKEYTCSISTVLCDAALSRYTFRKQSLLALWSIRLV